MLALWRSLLLLCRFMELPPKWTRIIEPDRFDAIRVRIANSRLQMQQRLPIFQWPFDHFAPSIREHSPSLVQRMPGNDPQKIEHLGQEPLALPVKKLLGTQSCLSARLVGLQRPLDQFLYFFDLASQPSCRAFAVIDFD